MKSKDQILNCAKKVIQIECDSLKRAAQQLGDDFVESVRLIANCRGRIIVTGIGKSAAIGNKIVATFNSTGTPSIFMHAAEALHGDLGLLLDDDVVVCISNSGNSPEIKKLVPFIQYRKNPIIALVGDHNSFLAKNATHIIDAYVASEASQFIEALTSSTAVQLALGDALALCLMELNGFSTEDFAKSHPGGALGKKLSLRVGQLLDGTEKPTVSPDASLDQVIYEIGSKRRGAVAVISKGRLVGMITDGDIRRMLQNNLEISEITAEDIMTKSPTAIKGGELATSALDLLKSRNISQVIVTDEEGTYQGIVHFHDLIKEGL